MTETKLIPRQRPQIPPKLEMKSNQVIFGDLSNSDGKMVKRTKKQIFGPMYENSSAEKEFPFGLTKHC